MNRKETEYAGIDKCTELGESGRETGFPEESSCEPASSVIEVHIHPPLSYKLFAHGTGDLVLEHEIRKGETPGDLIIGMSKGNPEAWNVIFDFETGMIRKSVLVLVNKVLVPHSEVHSRSLTDGDRIDLYLMYAGG